MDKQLRHPFKKSFNLKSPLVPVAVLMVLYLIAFYFFQSNHIYEITPSTNNDRFFSMDDSYYINSIYSTQMDTTLRIVKHPLLIAFAHYATLAEQFLFGNITMELHYYIVVMAQILIQVAAVYFLFRIMTEHYNVGWGRAALLTFIYGLSCASLIYTLIAESYALSGFLLILAYWFILRKKPIGAVICGILIGGVTITNIFIWGILMFFYKDTIIKRLSLMAAGGAGLLAAIAILPIRSIFYSNLFFVFVNSPRNYRDVFPLLGALERGFYALFGSTYFYINTINESPFGQFPGKAIAFIPEASSMIVVFMVIWVILLVLGFIKAINKRLLWAPALVLAFNAGLHVIIQYGLKEGFLYSLHHSFAQILILACLYGALKNRWSQRAMTVFLALYMVLMVFYNIQGGAELLNLYKG